MRTFELKKEIKFNERDAHAESLHSNDEGRALRFALLPGQSIEEHKATHSPVHIVVLQGQGYFKGADDIERECSEGMLIIFDSGEKHTVRAGDEKLVFLSILKENPASLLYDSEHRKMVEAQEQHHAHPSEDA